MGTEHPLIICQPQVLWGFFQAFPDSFSVWVCTACSWHGVSSCSSAAWPPLLPIPEKWKCPPQRTAGDGHVGLWAPWLLFPAMTALSGQRCKGFNVNANDWQREGHTKGTLALRPFCSFQLRVREAGWGCFFRGSFFLGLDSFFFLRTFPSGPAALGLLFKSTCWKHSGHVCVPLQSVPEDRPGFLSHKSRLVRPSHLGPRKMAPGPEIPSCSLTINVAYK